jgi:hypothetical protein
MGSWSGIDGEPLAELPSHEGGCRLTTRMELDLSTGPAEMVFRDALHRLAWCSKASGEARRTRLR